MPGMAQQQPRPQLQIDFSQTTSFVCKTPECNGDLFLPAVKFRTVPKLLTGAPTDQLVPQQVFFCTACGVVPAEFDVPE